MPTIPEVRAQFPQYSDLSDNQLADALHAKFYADMPKAEFRKKVGLKEESWGDYARGLGRQAVQGLTFNFGDELGLIDKQKTEEFAQEHPIASTVAGIAGGLPLFAAGPGAALARASMAGRSLLSNVGRSAGFGAGLGAVSGAGAGEGGVEDRLAPAAMGAAFGGLLGGAIPPAVAGAGRVAGAVSNLASRVRPRTVTEQPPIQPAGAPEALGPRAPGQTGPMVSFVDERTQQALGAQEGAFQMIADWITSAGGTADDLEKAWAAYQQATKYHSSGEAVSAATLAEIYPPLQRLLRAGASGYREVGQDATNFMQARQTGILPQGANQRDLAQRGVATRERFQEPMTVKDAQEQFGVRLGSNQDDPLVTGQLGRLKDAASRLFTVKDTPYHGFQPKAGQTAEQILEDMRAASKPAYDAAYAIGDRVPVQSTIAPILDRWAGKAAMAGKDIRRTLGGAVDQFRGSDKSYVTHIRNFDEAKQALDDQIERLIRAGENNKVRMLVQMKNELLDAVDKLGGKGGLGEKYAEARGIYARGARDRDILEEFKDAWKGDPEAVLRRYDSLPNKDAQKLARHAMVWGMEAENAGRRATQDATLGFDANRVEQILTGIGSRLRVGTEGMRKFGNYVGAEQQMVRGTAKTVIGGSMTDRNVQDALAMGGMEIVQNVQSFSNIWRGSTSLFEVGRALLEKIIDRSFGLSAERAREMSRILLTANPQEITAIIAKLRMTMPANRMARFNELMTQAQRAAAPGISAGAGAIAAPQQPSGPTFL